jgi:hypothetical protein
MESWTRRAWPRRGREAVPRRPVGADEAAYAGRGERRGGGGGMVREARMGFWSSRWWVRGCSRGRSHHLMVTASRALA